MSTGPNPPRSTTCRLSKG